MDLSTQPREEFARGLALRPNGKRMMIGHLSLIFVSGRYVLEPTLVHIPVDTQFNF